MIAIINPQNSTMSYDVSCKWHYYRATAINFFKYVFYKVPGREEMNGECIERLWRDLNAQVERGDARSYLERNRSIEDV